MKDLTILVTGSGDSSTSNIEDNLIDWIFKGNDSRNVKVIIPFTANMGKGMENFIKWGSEFFDWGSPDGDPMVAVIQGDHGHRVISKASSTTQVASFHDAVDTSMNLLSDAGNDGDEVAFISIFDPANEEDMQAVTVAKSYSPIPTYNLSEGMVDFFEGYESPEDKLKREQAVAEFEKNKPAEEVTKPATKKAATPRKRAAKKVQPQESKPLVQAAEKALEGIPVGTTGKLPVDAKTEFLQTDMARAQALTEEDPKPLAQAAEYTLEGHSNSDSVDVPALPKRKKEDPKLTASHSWDTWDGGMGWTSGKCRRCGISYPSGGEWVPGCSSGSFTGETPTTYSPIATTVSTLESRSHAGSETLPDPYHYADQMAAKGYVRREPNPLEGASPTLQDVPVGTVVEVAGTKFVKKGPNPFRDPLPTTQPVADEVTDSLLVKKSDLAKLGEDIKSMGEAFSSVMATFTKILKEN